MPIGARVAVLVFAHTCTSRGPILQPFGPRQPVGWYQVRYTDGAVETIEVAFGYHLTEWNRRHGQPLGPTFHRHAGYVATYPVDPLWQGKTAGGEDVTLYGMEWVNPHPEREVQSVYIRAAEASAAALIVAGITMVKTDGH